MTDAFCQNNTLYLDISKWQEMNPRLNVGFTTRNGGVSHSPYSTLNFGFHVGDVKEQVLKNRELLAEKLNIPLENWVSGEQTHQATIQIVHEQDKGKGAKTNRNAIASTDGLITNQQGILCTAFFADCVPLFFFDPVTEYIGIAHAGWKGTIYRIAEKMVREFESLGSSTENLLVAVGPCISQEKYEVDEHVISHIEESERQNTTIHQGNNHYLLDLKQLNTDILLHSGVLRNNIDVTAYCTFRDQHLFFSHRRDKGKTGRMLGFIGFAK